MKGTKGINQAFLLCTVFFNMILSTIVFMVVLVNTIAEMIHCNTLLLVNAKTTIKKSIISIKATYLVLCYQEKSGHFRRIRISHHKAGDIECQ